MGGCASAPVGVKKNVRADAGRISFFFNYVRNQKKNSCLKKISFEIRAIKKYEKLYKNDFNYYFDEEQFFQPKITNNWKTDLTKYDL